MTDKLKQIVPTIQQAVIDDIQQYLTKNNITYTATSRDFYTGLMLGVTYAFKHTYQTLTGEQIPELNTDDNKYIYDIINNIE